MQESSSQTSARCKSYKKRVKSATARLPQKLSPLQAMPKDQLTAPPEDLEDKMTPLTPSSAVWALGIIVYIMLTRLHEKVAIKDSIQHKGCYKHEIGALYHVQIYGGHPHICDLREYSAGGQKFCIVMNHVNGWEMFDHLIQTRPYNEADAA